MSLVDSGDFLARELAPRLAQQRIDEETAAHSDPPMNAPHGELDPRFLERFAPREHVLVDAVDERSIEVEEKRW
jgi:hypothetical protein